ncbi:DUF4396 domain-containing protein [Litorisediminicola beolgyonensis]|uniref:DUF4396 domain-containing protein n=1 Tax=Litorisediminicola beolgyonensis TaxID=1173614 RepID=A0ABW3ZMX1_9RHOB
MDALARFLDSPAFLIGWIVLMVPSLVWTLRDLFTRNAHLMPLMKLVWALTVLYSGPIGLMIYCWSGRKEIAADGLWRRAARSVAHCYSGCGMGEILGVILAAGLLSLGAHWVSVITFSLAYVFGYALTVGPLVQDGVDLRTALKDAAIAETPSITVMEVTAIGISLWLAGGAGIGELRFWTALIVSLTCGLAAAYPVNVLLIRYGVKEGMMDPRMTDHGEGHGDHDHGAAHAGEGQHA